MSDRGAVPASALLLALCALSTGARAEETHPAQVHRRGPPPPAVVRRVVSLAPSLSELVLALGAGDLLVGVTRFDDDPRVAALPRVGGYNDPEPEAVLRLKPDLVLAQPAPENRGPVETLGRLGIAVEAFPLGTVEEIDAALGAVGARLGRAAEAALARSRIRAAREEARRAAAGRPRPRVLLVFGLEPLVVSGRGGFAGQLLDDAGAENATDDPRGFFRLSAEVAALSRPQLVVLCGVEEPKGRDALPGLAGIPRAALASTALLRPGPRIPEALADLRAALRSAKVGP